MENHGAEIFNLKVRCGKQRFFSCFIEKIFGLRKIIFYRLLESFTLVEKYPAKSEIKTKRLIPFLSRETLGFSVKSVF